MAFLSKIKMQDGTGSDLTSTLVGNKQSLDVNVAQTVQVNAFNPGTIDIFGNLIIGERNNQILLDFSNGIIESKLNTTITGTASENITSGKGVFSTGTGVTSSYIGYSTEVVNYSPGHEIYAEFSVSFTTPTSSASNQKIGWYDSNNGFYIGFTGLTFGITRRSGAVNTVVARTSFSEDLLTGVSTSKFTRAGVPESIDLTKINVFRIRLGWLGTAPIIFEVLSPDGVWVIFHKILYPNSSVVPSILATNLPMTVEVNKTSSDATNLEISTVCWSAGNTGISQEPMQGESYSSFAPDPSNVKTGENNTIRIDAAGALVTRSTVLTDEDSLRDDFVDNSLLTNLAGTVSFTNGSNVVTGSGTSFTISAKYGDYIKLSTDSETFYGTINSIENDKLIYLSDVYGGATGSGTGHITKWKTTTGAGSSFAMSSSILSLTLPTTTGITSGFLRHGDYGPMKFIVYYSIDNRTANQTIQVGFRDKWSSPQAVAYFEFTGTTNTVVTCVSGEASNSLQTTNLSLPFGGVSSSNLRYEINVSDDSVDFSVDGVVLAQHVIHIPSTYQVMDYGMNCVNTGTVAGATVISIDTIHFKNFDSLEVSTNTSSKALEVVTSTPAPTTGIITSTQSFSALINGSTSIGTEITGTWTGSLNIEGLVGSTWVSVDAFNTATELISPFIIANGVYVLISVAGITQIRIRGNTVLTGSAIIYISPNSGTYTYPIFSRSQGATIGSYGIQLGGVDATTDTFQFQKVNTLGAAGVYLESSNKATYSVSIVPVTPPATPTDVVRISGSATKTVRILKIVLNTTATAIGIQDWYIVKRSTANSGGTSAAIVSVPMDSLFAAPTAVCLRYTANPTTLGTSIGNVAICNILSSTVAPGTSGTAYIPYVFDFTNNPIVLRGVQEGLCINFNAAALPGGLSVNCQIVFTEE